VRAAVRRMLELKSCSERRWKRLRFLLNITVLGCLGLRINAGS